MSFGLSKDQIIRTKPNSKLCYAVCMPIHYKTALFAFASDNLIFIYDRTNFSETIIETPEPSSIINLLSFITDKNYNSYILCTKSNNRIYQFSITDTSNFHVYDGIKTKSVIKSITSSLNHFFYISDTELFSCEINSNDSKFLSNVVDYNEVISSPNGSALALFSRNTQNLQVLYSPFTGQSFNFHFTSNLIDFQWNCSHYLCAVTTCSDMSIKIWLQEPTASEMQCISSIILEEPITTVAFCHNFSDAEFIVSNYHTIVQSAVPTIKRPKAQIIVTTSQSILLCREDNSQQLSVILSSGLPFDEPIATICNLIYLYSNGELVRRFDISFFTNFGLHFHQLELSSTKYLELTPFQIKFFTNEVKKFLPYKDHIITEMSNNQAIDWFTESGLDYIDINSNIRITSNAIKIKGQSIKAQLLDIQKNSMILYCASNLVTFLLIHNDEQYTFEYQSDTEVVSGSIHSEFVFCISTKTSVICFIYDNDKGYQILAKLDLQSPSIVRFHPCSYLLLAVSYENYLCFYSLRYHHFDLLKQIETVPILDFAYQKDCIVVSTKHMIYFLDINFELPKVHSMNDDYVFYTALTMSRFSVVSKILNYQVIKKEDFSIFDCSFIFESPYKNSPNNYDRFSDLKLNRWQELDEKGQRFLFSYHFSVFNDLKLIPFFSIWAYLSDTQHILIDSLDFNSVDSFIDSYTSVWVKEDSVLKQFIEYVVSKAHPSEESFETYLLLCILIKKNQMASRVASFLGQTKISECLNDKNVDRVKVEKSAYEALKIHRYSLASLFFILIEQHYQAIQVLANRPLLMLLVARILHHDQSIQEIYDKKLIFKEFEMIDDFYCRVFNKDVNGAVDILINGEIPSCDLISLEVHRCEMIRSMINIIPNCVLVNLQFCPYFMIKENQIIQGNHTEIKEIPKKDEFTFDFGESIDNDIIDYSDDYTESNQSNTMNSNEINATTPNEIQANRSQSTEIQSKSNELSINTKNEMKSVINNDHLIELFNHIHLFTPISPICFTTNELYIVHQINKLFNLQFNDKTVKILTSIIKLITDRSTIAAILFSLSFSLSKSSFIIPLLSSLDFHLENYFDEFESTKINSSKPPDLLSQFASHGIELTQNDIDIVNCLVFDKISSNLSSMKQSPVFYYLPQYFHHRHRILFEMIKSFNFSNNGIIDDISPLDLDPINNLLKMEKVCLHEKWLISFETTFKSPFYIDQSFTFTNSFLLKSGVDSPVRGISIDNVSNEKIAVVSRSLNAMNICEEKLNGKCGVDSDDEKSLYFYSPFSPYFTSKDISQQNVKPNKEFQCHWSQSKIFKTFLKVTACCSHPNNEIYVTGETNGNLRTWDYTNGISRAVYLTSFSKNQIDSISFNQSGNKVICVDKEGRVYLDDIEANSLKGTQIVCCSNKATASWFNDSNQIAVIEPQMSLFNIYDIRVSPNESSVVSPCQKSISTSQLVTLNNDNMINSSKLSTSQSFTFDCLKPIFSYQFDCPIKKKHPIDCWEYRIAFGNPKGSLYLFDIRNMAPLSKQIHKGRIRALQFHQSGTFILTGGSDNSICFIDPNQFGSSKYEVITDVLPTSIYDKKKGITAVATSKQSIVVGGYSNMIKVYTVLSEKGKAYIKSYSTAIDLRNLGSNTLDSLNEVALSD